MSNDEQDNWAELLPCAEFAYLHSVHALTRMTLLCAKYHQNPEMQFKPPKPSHLNSKKHADATLKGLAEPNRTLCENIQDGQRQQTKYGGGKEPMFGICDKVWHPTRHFLTTRPSKTPEYKHVGLYTVSWVINRNAYKLDLLKTMPNHNILHASQCDWYTAPVSCQPPNEHLQMIVNYLEQQEVDCVLDPKWQYRKFDYFNQWAGYWYAGMSREPAGNLRNARGLVDEFHRDHRGNLR